MVTAFFHGMILAFGLIMPLGVQNIFIFNQGATQKHFWKALPSIMTAALCDTALILLAVLGISAIVLTIPWLKTGLFSLGFFFLMYMGWVTWKTKPKKLQEGHKSLSAKKQILFAGSVSLLNPHAWIDTIVVIGTNSLNFSGNDKIMYTFSCILVSCLWFLGLATAGHFLHKLDKKGMLVHWVNKLSAFIIWGVGLYVGSQIIW